jgi:hypothetical protein
MGSTAERIPTFRLFQLSGWLAYGIILVLSTIPFANERATIAYRSVLFGCCFIASFVMMWFAGDSGAGVSHFRAPC